MATGTFTVNDLSITSTWSCIGWGGSDNKPIYSSPSTVLDTRSFTDTLATLPAGTTISSAILSATRSGSGTCRIESNNAGSVDVTAKVSAQGTYNASFSFTATGGTGASTQSDVGKTYSATGRFTSITLTLVYTLPYSSCTAPTSVSVAPSTVAYGKTATLSWSGAQAGTNNPISKYEIYRATSSSGSYSLLGTTTGTSYSVTAMSSAGTYYYKVKTIGTASGYDSDLSSSYAALTAQVSGAVAPAYVTVSPELYESGNISLVWPAGSGGNGAAITYGIQYGTSADGSTWSGWTQLATVSTLNYNHAPDLTRGSFIKYRVCTIISAYSLTSGYTESGTVQRNQTPLAPTWVLPAANATTHSATPAIQVTVGAEPDGTEQYLQASIDGGTYYTLAILPAEGGTVVPVLSLAAGTHAITLRVTDPLGAASATASRSITCTVPTWTRSIATGTVIANTSISHRTDINELRTRVNVPRAYYGLTALTLPGTVGKWADWQRQMEALQQGLADCFAAAGRAAPAWLTVPAYPTASIINQIRTQVASV